MYSKNNKIKFTFRMPQELFDQLCSVAGFLKISPSAYLRQIIRAVSSNDMLWKGVSRDENEITNFDNYL